MAISKQQPMRPAEIALVDASNRHDLTLQAHAQSLNTLIEDLGDETSARANGDTALQGQIGEGFSPDLTIAQSLSATNAAVSDIEAEIGTGFDSQNTVTAYAEALDLFLGERTDLDDTVVNSILALVSSSESLESFASRFKIGCVNNITIPANDSVSTSETFAAPFAQDDICVLFAQVVTNELSNLFTYTLIDCTYSGFSYSIANSDADAHTVSLGYIAIKVN
jgi:hypothetical protein